jgi:hypothetical protein
MKLSAADARRIALAAQGFAAPRPGRVDRRAVRRLFDRVQLLQMDSVNVLVRAQELPLWSRLGAHRRDLVPAMVADAELFEYWGHEASLIPVAMQPLFRWRMEAARRGVTWAPIARFARRRRDYIATVLDEVRARGPLAAGELSEPRRKKGTWWSWGDGKRALEYLFWTGAVTATRRPNTFERIYDLPERRLPAAVLATPTPDEADAHRELLARAARALGVATAGDLADYFRIRRPAARRPLDELVEAGRLARVAVEGWREPAYLDPAAAAPAQVEARALVSPFDSLVWERARTERLFGFRYRIEIYTPAPQRRFGYYVLPFLLGDRLVARVDLKADRAAGVLRAPGAFAEPGVDRGAVAEALAVELRGLAAWLGLAAVEVGGRGDLARPLRKALKI